MTERQQCTEFDRLQSSNAELVRSMRELLRVVELLGGSHHVDPLLLRMAVNDCCDAIRRAEEKP